MKPTISELVKAVRGGDRSASETLFTALYAELRRMAQRELARHGSGGTLGATTLLHEAYLDMSQREGLDFPDRARFMGYASRVMRGLIIDHARHNLAQKRGGRFELVSLNTAAEANRVDANELSSLGEVLDELAETEPALAEVVDLKYFCGLTFDEIAAMKGTSTRTDKRAWEKARAYLYGKLKA
jgi:RNA polymerase sigma factor (TIGR02999 family)